ncbi:MAG: type I-MYXAN CRISPR-associated protein Cas6/Cmx6 [Thiohalomonadales bacterium]|nr:type I-MYXAN CRISPR-associated protein Cas6/Cmx6 [Thiohalomonadales bacterium]
MYWTEDTDDKKEVIVPDNVLDVVYSISCKCIPMEHAHALSEALQQALPWLEDEEQAGIHQVYGAESGNGWERPDTEVLYLSRRQKLTLRLPKIRLDEAKSLIGQTLDIAGFPLEVGDFTTRKLSDLPTLFARSVLGEANQSEDEFMVQAVAQLNAMGISVKKMMCGKEGQIELPDATLHTRSLMLADLELQESVKLQEVGLGSGRKLGCGLFVPQKGITAVKPD